MEAQRGSHLTVTEFEPKLLVQCHRVALLRVVWPEMVARVIGSRSENSWLVTQQSQPSQLRQTQAEADGRRGCRPRFGEGSQ